MIDGIAYMKKWCARCKHANNQRYEINGVWIKTIGCGIYKQTIGGCIDDNVFELYEVKES
jgi:hypothetical protein